MKSDSVLRSPSHIMRKKCIAVNKALAAVTAHVKRHFPVGTSVVVKAFRPPADAAKRGDWVYLAGTIQGYSCDFNDVAVNVDDEQAPALLRFYQTQAWKTDNTYVVKWGWVSLTDDHRAEIELEERVKSFARAK